MSNQLVERFIKYIKKDTRSDASSNTVPSTQNQVEFLNFLKEELIELGYSDVKLNTSNYFLTATIPATTDKNIPTIGFISHIDTANFESENINPQFIENYDGNDIPLGDSGFNLSPSEFPNLKNYIGQTLITTDGTTLLGADDKAGVAEIVTAGHFLIQNPQIEHGTIRVAFGPDEEIGRGADLFDVEEFGCDFAYTMDGSQVGELEYECFNAAALEVEIQGLSVHTGTAKNKLINALKLAIEYNESLPKFEAPEHTEGYEGFYHLESLNGNSEFAKIEYIIRDHDKKLFEKKKEYAEFIADRINQRFETPRISVKLKDSYYNMAEIIEKDFTCVDLAKSAMQSLNITPKIQAIRGGTDGSKISFMGLPTPNIFAGGENFHGRYEFVAVESMEKACRLIIEIAKKAVELN